VSDAQLYLISSVTTLMLVAAVTGLIALSRQLDDVLLQVARIKHHLGLIDRPQRRRTLTNLVRRALHRWRATRSQPKTDKPQAPPRAPDPATTAQAARPPIPAPPTAPIAIPDPEPATQPAIQRRRPAGGRWVEDDRGNFTYQPTTDRRPTEEDPHP
jgi:hypothetical protein